MTIDEIAHATIGAAIAVHREMGPGFLESIYEEALAIELGGRGIAFQRQVAIAVRYRDHVVGESRLDLVVEDELLIELKAVNSLHPIHTAQVISYLKAGGFHLGLILNFNAETMRDGIRRVIWT